MNDTDFFSSNTYIFLPTKITPKVALAVDNAVLAENAFKLYNPFSQKAKFLKTISEFSLTNFNSISKIILRAKKEKKSAFISYLESKLNTPLVSSLYFATTNDKVVLQLQTVNSQIIGYLKYPLNEIGILHLENEKKAIDILSNKKIVKSYLLYDKFNDKPFLLLQALEGQIGLIERSYIDKILIKLKREGNYRLMDHPRVHQLGKSLLANNMSKYQKLMEKICQSSTVQYSLAYEHGDFAPWNIVKIDESYVPFDFEYFVEDGLEYFDIIKYYYQIGKLLQQLEAKELIEFICLQIKIEEINKLLQLFLIKEILRNKEENGPFKFEVNMLETMEK